MPEWLRALSIVSLVLAGISFLVIVVYLASGAAHWWLIPKGVKERM